MILANKNLDQADNGEEDDDQMPIKILSVFRSGVSKQ